ncbi:head-tail connector protein [Lysinibacillus sphaericus]|uniref:head-tail connector protein n=1 Tax=Lysinibacillus sphaericus TaxID=1421 RepID=UPI003D067462
MLLEHVKKSLRVSSTTFDDEIQSLINAAELELKRCGVFYKDADDLVKQAIVQFCKSRFGYDNKEAERFEKIFYDMASSMSLSGEYYESLE